MTTNSSFFELPTINDSTPSWNDPGQYSFTEPPKSNPAFDLPSKLDPEFSSQIDSIFIDSISNPNNQGQSEQSQGFWGGLWDWANTDIGSSVVGGAIGGIDKAWSIDMAADAINEQGDKNRQSTALLQQKRIDAEMEMHQADLAQEMEMFMMKEARKDKHNASINAPVSLNPRAFKN